jgi:hypothetical protein
VALFTARWLAGILFVGFGLPLAVQDQQKGSVSLWLLVGSVLSWFVAAMCLDGSAGRLLSASIVLLAGCALLLILPGRLGIADVIFMSGMGLLFSFWSLIIAFVLGCLATFLTFIWLSRGYRRDTVLEPLPFLPGLYWGGLTVIIGGLRF